MWCEETLAFDHSVRAVSRTEWFVYICDSPALREISFIIVASVFTTRGIFTYQVISDSLAFGDGRWKKAGCCGLSFCTYFDRHQYESPISPVEYSRVRLSWLLFSAIPPWWFFVWTLWTISAYSCPSASLTSEPKVIRYELPLTLASSPAPEQGYDKPDSA